MTTVFTKTKFTTLKPEKQHKILADLLHALYLSPSSLLQEEYNLYAGWLALPGLSIFSNESISHLYHHHLRHAGVELKEHQFLPYVKQNDDQTPQPSLGYTLFLDGLRSAHNVGSILRTVEAFRLGKVLFSPETPWIDQKKVRDASMGAWEWVECAQASIPYLVGPLVALETSPEALPLSKDAIPPHSTLLIGNEEFGCSAAALARADLLVSIPLRGKKNSLNVANAVAIAAYILSI